MPVQIIVILTFAAVAVALAVTACFAKSGEDRQVVISAAASSAVIVVVVGVFSSWTVVSTRNVDNPGEIEFEADGARDLATALLAAADAAEADR